jgi:hypothetical protein
LINFIINKRVFQNNLSSIAGNFIISLYRFSISSAITQPMIQADLRLQVHTLTEISSQTIPSPDMEIMLFCNTLLILNDEFMISILILIHPIYLAYYSLLIVQFIILSLNILSISSLVQNIILDLQSINNLVQNIILDLQSINNLVQNIILDLQPIDNLVQNIIPRFRTFVNEIQIIFENPVLLCQ